MIPIINKVRVTSGVQEQGCDGRGVDDEGHVTYIN